MAVAICQGAYHKECGLSVSLDQPTHQPVVIPEAWQAAVEGTVFVLRFFQIFLDLSCRMVFSSHPFAHLLELVHHALGWCDSQFFKEHF